MCDSEATVKRQWSDSGATVERQWSEYGATVERQWSDEGDPSRNIFATVERLYTYEEDYTCII
jgi:hypothetical protein